MYSSLDLDLRPGSGLGIFEIGSSLWSVLDLLRQNNTTFPRVDIKFEPQPASTTPVILHVPPHLNLLFSGRHQRLRTITLQRLRDPSLLLTLRYREIVLSSSDEKLKRVDVSRHFGPTYPGDGLQYPGVIFSFDEDGIAEGFVSPISGVDDRLREVRRVIVTQNDPDGEESDALDEVLELPSMFGSIRRAVVKAGEGIDMYFYPSSSQPVRVRIGMTSAQDLNCDLGPPLRVYHKEDDRMAIHATKQSHGTIGDAYFYNYFQHGIDFMLSGTSHLVQKIILHSNVPGSPMFQRYQRCPWEIEGEPEDEEDDSPPRMQFFDKFEIISHFLNPNSRHDVPSMLLDRADDDMLTLPGATTRTALFLRSVTSLTFAFAGLAGFEGVILEVTESGQVTTAMVF
ncbi:hypothetical protein BD410DRAFT_758470 [Rickenella mellea]|uniref:Uncharacterized protein n=1 Tax=Rickenella mellea TaxID=50990 RepID=A0A4V6PN27_9AGAM|nr:hypothetical protein BD410DRAFT_758470 [Rickenella mellea]